MESQWLSIKSIIAALLLLIFLATGLPAVSAAARSAPTSQPLSQLETPASLIPMSLRRRAVEFLESLRGSEHAPAWQHASLGAGRPLYRPDVLGIAYYEFLVTAPTAMGSEPAGFLILSTSDHDFPIAQWSATGDSPTHELERRASTAGREVARFYKLDTLSYAAEDSQGQLVAMLGALPVKIAGAAAVQLDSSAGLTTSTWNPDSLSPSDAQLGSSGGTLTTTGPTPPESLKISAWATWQELKADYGASYKPFIEALRRTAQPGWQLETTAVERGVSLGKGQTYVVPLLSDQATSFAVEGQGAQLVQAELVAHNVMTPSLRIYALDQAQAEELPLWVTIQYMNGDVETIPLAINGQLATASTLPSEATATNDEAPPASSAGVEALAVGEWEPWIFYWAGSEADQRLYDQIPGNSYPNTSGCVSGCGATAWAMLFGWADNQAASGNPYWAPRWGLYRANGGREVDAVAPRFMDDGIRNMTWEMHGHIGTFCLFGNGATFPWNMAKATQYLSGRSGTQLVTHYNFAGIHEDSLRVYARDSIRDRHTPAIIGTGWLTHYPLAYGYASQSRTVRACPVCWWNTVQYNRWFYVNQGWGGNGNTWVPASTWFAGEIYP